MLVQVSDAAGALWGWDVLDADGCTGSFDTDATQVTIDYLPWSRWGSTSNQVVMLDCDFSDDCELRAGQGTVAVSSGVYDIEYTDATASIGLRFAIHWAMAYAEERKNYHTSQTFYGAQWDTQADTKGAQADLLIGRQPTVSIRFTANARKKYTIAHEYGHLQTLVSVIPQSLNYEDIDFCYPSNCADIDGMLNHTFDSQEWQSAAAAEGFAHFYAMSVWNDLSESVGVRATPGDDELSINAFKTDGMPTSIYETQYDGAMGDHGTAVERDWAFFLWDLATGTGAIDVSVVMFLLADAYDPAWPAPSDTSSDWWDHFETEAYKELSITEQSKFDTAAAARWVNR